MLLLLPPPALNAIPDVLNFLRLASQIRFHLRANRANGFKGGLITQALMSERASIVLVSAVSAWWLCTSLYVT